MSDKKSTDVQIPLEKQEYTVSAQEMSLMLNMITIVARRGAFQPAEFKVVGEFFEKYAPKGPEESQNDSKENDSNEKDITDN